MGIAPAPVRRLANEEILNFLEIFCVVDDFSRSDKRKVSELFWRLGDLLWESARHLELDEHVSNLILFANCVACDVAALSQGKTLADDNYWEWQIFLLKRNGENSPSSDIRTVEKQKIAMAGTLARLLKFAPNYIEVSEALMKFHDENDLWLEADWVLEECGQRIFPPGQPI